MTSIFKICSRDEWAEAVQVGTFRGSDVDRRDGFIHFSTAEQVAETAIRHFADRRGLILVEVAATSLGNDLKWEPSRGGALFPHLYGDLSTSSVSGITDLPDDPSDRTTLLAGLAPR